MSRPVGTKTGGSSCDTGSDPFVGNGQHGDSARFRGTNAVPRGTEALSRGTEALSRGTEALSRAIAVGPVGAGMRAGPVSV
jgi:hypothetical protein